MAQVRKLSGGETVPTPKKGNISYNGTISEFSDEIYNSLIKYLDTSAASGIIRKGFDVGRQEGNTFNYDSEHNRAYVVDANGKKIWDYQATIGPRSDFKVKWQGTFGRQNLNKNPNDVNRLLQEVMKEFNPSTSKEVPIETTIEESPKKEISADAIEIQLGKDKTVSVYDSAYSNAINRLKLLKGYYDNPESFVNEYEFTDKNPWKTYLDVHKTNLNSNMFDEIMNRVSLGQYTNDDEEILNALGISLNSQSPIVDKKDGSPEDINKDGKGKKEEDDGNQENKSQVVPGPKDKDGNLVSYSFNDYYLPQYYDATVTKASGLPEHLWSSAKSWTDPSGNNYLELTNQEGNKYYVYHVPKSNAYLRSNSDPNNIFLSESDFWDLVEKNNFTPDPTDSWETLKWMPRSELVRTTEGGPISVMGLEVLNIGNENIPIRKDLSENPKYYAKLGNGVWVILSQADYERLKSGDLSVLNNKKPMRFYKDGGILKMQNTPGGKVPTYDLTGTYVVPVFQDPSSTPISTADKIGVMATGIGSGVAVIGALSRHPTVKRVTNIASLLGFGVGTAANLVSNYQNTGKLDLGALGWSIYGLGRGFAPRPKQRYFHNANIPTNASASRGARMWKGVQNYAPKIGQTFDLGRGALGTTFGVIGTTNFIKSIASDPDKTMNWKTWTSGDARNFQMGMSGLIPIIAGSANMRHNAHTRKQLPQNTNKLGSLDEINFALKPGTQFGLKRNMINYIKTNPIKEAYFGSPYTKAINVIEWNNPATSWGKSMFTFNPFSIGLTGGISPYEFNPVQKQAPIEFVTTEVPVQKDTIRVNGGMLFKRGGKILKAYNGMQLYDPSIYTRQLVSDDSPWRRFQVTPPKIRDWRESLYESMIRGIGEGAFGEFRKLELRRQLFPEEFVDVFASKTAAHTPEEPVKPETPETPEEHTKHENGNEGDWSQGLSISGSGTPLGLELTKLLQSIGTTKKNTAIEQKANDEAARAQYLPASEKMQLGYDFSAETKALNDAIGQLRSQYKTISSTSSDNKQMLAGFNMFGDNLSKLLDNYNKQISAKESNINNANIELATAFNQSERDRLKYNSTVAANNIFSNAQSEIQKGTNISKDINSGINTLQNWIYKDRMMESGLESLNQQKTYLLQLQSSDIDVRYELANIEQQIADAQKKLQMLPSFKLK